MTNIDATTDHRTLSAFEDAEQAHALSWPDVTLYSGKRDEVLRGPYQGMHVATAVMRCATPHLDAGRDVVTAYLTLRPWWRLWRPTRAIRITVRAMAGGFEQDFCDGGPV